MSLLLLFLKSPKWCWKRSHQKICALIWLWFCWFGLPLSKFIERWSTIWFPSILFKWKQLERKKRALMLFHYPRRYLLCNYVDRGIGTRGQQPHLHTSLCSYKASRLYRILDDGISGPNIQHRSKTQNFLDLRNELRCLTRMFWKQLCNLCCNNVDLDRMIWRKSREISRMICCKNDQSACGLWWNWWLCSRSRLQQLQQIATEVTWFVAHVPFTL